MQEYFNAEEREILRKAIDYIGTPFVNEWSCKAIDRAGCDNMASVGLSEKWNDLLIRRCSMYNTVVSTIVPLSDHKMDINKRTRCNLRRQLLSAAADANMQLFEEIIKGGYE